MADSPVGKLENEILQFLQENKSTEYSTLVKAFVDRYENKEVALKNPAGATIVICGLSATSYRDKKKTVEGLNSFYLPDEVEMQVVGEVKLTPCSWMMLLLVTCKDRQLYAYDDETEELHMVAQDLEGLLHEGLEYPASLTYYKGEAFEKMTHEDWDKVKKSDFGKSLEQEHHELVTAKKGQMLESLGYKASGTEREWEIKMLKKEFKHLTEEIRHHGYRERHVFRTELMQRIMIMEETVEQYTKYIEHLPKKAEVNEQIRHSMEMVRHLREEMKHLNKRLKHGGRFGRRTEMEQEIEKQVDLLIEHFECLKRQLKYGVDMLLEHGEIFDSADDSDDDYHTSASLTEGTEQQKRIKPIFSSTSSMSSSSVESSRDLKLLKERGGGPKKQVNTEGNVSPPTLSR